MSDMVSITFDTDKTPTERIRAMLDERGVKFSADDGRFSKATSWLAGNGKLATFAEYQDSSTTFSMDSLSLTPEQAIAATLGERHDTTEISKLLDEFEHECFMIRVEASETRAKDDDVRKAYERQREKTAQAIAATLGNELNPDGLPAGLTISEDSELLNWRGENYVRQVKS